MEKKDIQTVEKNMDKATEMSKGMVPMEWQDAFLVCVCFQNRSTWSSLAMAIEAIESVDTSK